MMTLQKMSTYLSTAQCYMLCQCMAIIKYTDLKNKKTIGIAYKIWSKLCHVEP